MFAAWLIGFASEKNLSTEITEMKVADEIERKMVKNPWNWQNPSLNCHDCCEKVTIENGITRAVMKNCVDVKPTRNKLLTVRIDVLVRMRQRTAKLLNAATTSRTENKTTATIFIFRYSSCWRSQRFSILFFFSAWTHVSMLIFVVFASSVNNLIRSYEFDWGRQTSAWLPSRVECSTLCCVVLCLKEHRDIFNL